MSCLICNELLLIITCGLITYVSPYTTLLVHLLLSLNYQIRTFQEGVTAHDGNHSPVWIMTTAACNGKCAGRQDRDETERPLHRMETSSTVNRPPGQPRPAQDQGWGRTTCVTIIRTHQSRRRRRRGRTSSDPSLSLEL